MGWWMMSTKIKTVDDIRCGRDAKIVAERQMADVKKVGSYLRIDARNGTAHVPDSARAMPKPEREFLIRLLKSIGLIVLVAACGAIGYVFYAPYF